MRIRNSRQNVFRARRPAASRAAFTLIEMMVVVAIIVALAGLGIFYMAGQVDEAYQSKAKADIKSLETAITAYKVHHAGQWPPNLEILLQPEPGRAPYLTNEENLIDPWGNRYQYQVGNTVKPEIYTQVPNVGKITNLSNRIQ